MKADFLRQNPPQVYWNKRVVQFKGAAPFIVELPSAGQLVQILSGAFISGQWVEPLGVKINASRLSDDGSSQQMLALGIEEARKAYNNGFSLCSGDLSDDIPSLRELKADSSNYFENKDLIAITGYLSPINAVGVLHFDRQHNFFIQVEGSKRWTVSERAAITNPFDNLVYTGTPQKFFDSMGQRGYKILMPRDCGRATYDLMPGDVLYVPPGYYHSPETTSGGSLHYTLTIEPACFWKTYNDRLFDVMLANTHIFLEDYRFLDDVERMKLFEECLRLANQIDPRSN